jgi:hypothetical protein
MWKELDKKLFEGKTIKSIDDTSCNVAIFHFTDGTSVELWTEIFGRDAIPQLGHFTKQPAEEA